MEHQTDREYLECRIRLDAALDSLTLASSRLKDVIFTGPDETVNAALANLRLARVLFLEARADYREAHRLGRPHQNLRTWSELHYRKTPDGAGKH